MPTPQELDAFPAKPVSTVLHRVTDGRFCHTTANPAVTAKWKALPPQDRTGCAVAHAAIRSGIGLSRLPKRSLARYPLLLPVIVQHRMFDAFTYFTQSQWVIALNVHHHLLKQQDVQTSLEKLLEPLQPWFLRAVRGPRKLPVATMKAMIAVARRHSTLHELLRAVPTEFKAAYVRQDSTLAKVFAHHHPIEILHACGPNLNCFRPSPRVPLPPSTAAILYRAVPDHFLQKMVAAQCVGPAWLTAGQVLHAWRLHVPRAHALQAVLPEHKALSETESGMHAVVNQLSTLQQWYGVEPMTLRKLVQDHIQDLQTFLEADKENEY